MSNEVFPEAIIIKANLGAGFVELPDVIQAQPIQTNRGIPGTSARDRLATTGGLTFTLDNSEENSAGLLGRYSLNNANTLSGWHPGIPIQAFVRYLGVDEPIFVGKLVDVVPVSGRYRDRKVQAVCVDWMEEAATAKARGISVQENKRSDEIFSTLLAAVAKQPVAKLIGIGGDTYPYALDNALDEEVSVLTEWQRLLDSEQGFGFVKRDGTVVFQGRHRRTNLFTLSATLTDADLYDVDASRGVDEVYNKALVQAHPRRVDTAATTVLFTLASKPRIERGVTQKFNVLYRDPLARATRAGGKDMVQPVASTDYTFNTKEDGTGTDITAQLTVTAVYGGNSGEVTVVNNGPSDGYLTKLQCRGRGIYDYETTLASASSSGSVTKYGERTFSLDMPYQHDPLVAADAASYIVAQSKHLITQVRSVTFIANREDRLMKAALQIDIGERIRLEETVIGTAQVQIIDEPQPVSALEFFINAVDLTINERGIIFCTWTLVPADPFNYWILERTGFTELDYTTRLGYGSFIAGWVLDESTLGSGTRVNP